MNGEISIKDWILTIETYIHSANVPHNLRVHIALSYLKGAAFNIGKKHYNESSWDELKEELRGFFTLIQFWPIFKPFIQQRLT
jgi:hypothetical protein